MEDLIRSELGIMQDGTFEKLIRRVMPRFNEIYKNIEPTYNFKGKTTKGPVDLYCYKETTHKYSAFICTTQSSGIKNKVLGDIKRLRSEECHIREKIDEVFICTNTCIKSEAELYRELCNEYGWQCQIFSLERLTCLIDENPDISNDICSKYINSIKKIAAQSDLMREPEKERPESEKNSIEKYYSCGPRVKVIRNDIGLSKSRFIELIEFNSERKLESIESNNLEVDEPAILSISSKTGASYLWLKHSEGPKYEHETISTYDLQKVEEIKRTSPKSLYLMINESSMSILLAAHIENYNWKIFTFTFDLDFWNWLDEKHRIPEILNLLKEFHKEFGYTIKGRVIDSKIYERAASGNEHPSSIIKDTQGRGNYWLDDLIDSIHSPSALSTHSSWYGEWFTKLHSYFR